MKTTQFLVNTSGVAALYVLALAAQFGTDVLVARTVPKSDFGSYAFVKQTAILITSFAFMGLDQAIVRVVARKKLEGFAWKSLWLRIVGISGVIVVITTGVVSLLYDIGTSNLIAIALSAVAMVMILLASSMMRANQNFLLGQTMQNLWRYLLAFLVMVALLSHRLSDGNIISLFLLSLVLNAGYVLIAVVRGKQTQGVKISLIPLYKEAFIFWFFMSSLALVNSLDHLMLGKLASFADVGSYTALWTVIGAPFLVFATSLGYVALPLVVRGTTRSTARWRCLGPVTFVIIVFALLWYTLASPVLGLVYSGRYAASSNLIAVFVLAGVLRAFYTLPSVVLGGRADTGLLLKFLMVALTGVAVHVTLDLLLIPHLGVLGAAYGYLANWTIRCGGGIGLVFMHRQSLGFRSRAKVKNAE